ncbi:galactose ABC transporter substrate-binding protein [Clostridium beijerinckii]|uniref:galactose ABC transporter substrate-binding protein n=1 Tax=Clostridium beijerinckii TaxID=1520 RepID=UPI00098C7810|nr:galactose ABC transporter substrate-binding protein [Clostridium beijerinckii]MBA8932861.1 methyl-galactoside transport system substrate-binding protein [Clostridium beijerinckii]NOW06196.1 methyl-galactoside transport system substrate-binding protein [Clostridium beijerinckii]NRU37064.1 methyl-galactoside transport system substrate-binding protein [Clostridium beijerinckii]NSA99657.1 methyl-galactoside transport system substrate-binding protein [Clostridium beijerinckii]NYC00660.1 methyl-g
MRKSKKILVLCTIIIMIVNLLLNSNKVVANLKLTATEGRPVRASVLLRTLEDPYTALLKQSFEEIQKNNPENIEFTFYDCKNDQSLQNRNVNSILNAGNADIILLNLVDPTGVGTIVDRVKEKNVPLGLFNIEPLNMEPVKSYDKAYFVGTNPAEAGILQGELLTNLWNKDKRIIDKNGDNIMQYIMLMGPRDNLEAIGRTKYSVLSINDAGIRTEELALRVCNWEENLARDAMDALFLGNSNRIEVIISNNDAMAIGAIETLQKYGYNRGDKNRTIPIVGVDGIPKAIQLINQGIMTGSVPQDAASMAEATYLIGMNLVNGRPPLDGTSYKFDDTGVSVRIPYKGYISNDNI